MHANLIRNALFFGLIAITLSACSSTVEQVPVIETRVIEERRPSPIVPSVDQVSMRDVEWIIVTSENAEEIFQNLDGDAVLFAVTASGYENISMNLSDIRALVQQQQQIIAIYRNSYDR